MGSPDPAAAVDLRSLRDDGYLSRGLGRLAAGALPPLPPAAVGALVTAVLALAGFGQLGGITLFAPAAALLLAGVGAGHRHDGRADWLVPPILRGTEYLYLAALGDGFAVPGPLMFLLLAAVVAQHCDTAARLRCGVRPVPWVASAMLGWDGRMLLLAIGAMLGWLPFAYGLLAGYLWVLCGWTAITRWLALPTA